MNEDDARRGFAEAATNMDVGSPPGSRLIRRNRLVGLCAGPAQVATVVLAVLGIAVGTTVGLAGNDDASVNVAPAVERSTSPEPQSATIEDLTGKDVGLALGLQPLPTEGGPVCELFVEYEENGQSTHGFCLDSVRADPIERQILARQILGYKRTPLIEEYAAVTVAYHQLVSDPERDLEAQVEALTELAALKQEVHAQGRVTAEP